MLPTLMAGLVGSVVGWLIEDLTRPFLPLPIRAALGLAAAVAVFFPVRNWLRELRGDHG